MDVDNVDAVSAFYDRRPYPPPVADLDRHRLAWQDERRRRADYHLFWPAAPYREDLAILVAGCGTSQAARYALGRPAARVTAIDVSQASLGHTEALRRKYRLTNLTTHLQPIERIGEMQQTFDLIVCTGVLHHLADPDAGLRALRAVLRPDGAMHVMVYAPYGRVGLSMLQEYCRRLGIGTSDEEIRDLMTMLGALPPRHPLSGLLAESRDFQDADAVADALLNPRERTYSAPELFDFLERGGLRFERWLQQAPYLPQCGALAATPHAARLADLPALDQHAAVELWRGSLTRHSVIAHRSDSTEPARPVRFDDTRWLGYVPLRLPQTLCVQQRLPPGAAGVLLNQSHTHTDLILPIDAGEKRLFDAIDGHRTIAEIAGPVPAHEEGGQRSERARSLFERLWWYDQVVFDLTRAT